MTGDNSVKWMNILRLYDINVKHFVICIKSFFLPQQQQQQHTSHMNWQKNCTKERAIRENENNKIVKKPSFDCSKNQIIYCESHSYANDIKVQFGVDCVYEVWVAQKYWNISFQEMNKCEIKEKIKFFVAFYLVCYIYIIISIYQPAFYLFVMISYFSQFG